MLSSESTKILLETIKRLIRRGAMSNLRKIINKTHAADLALIFRLLTPREQKLIFDLMERTEQKAELFREVEHEHLVNVIEDMPPEKIVEILHVMPRDDVADILEKFDKEQTRYILELMREEDSAKVKGLLRYDTKTAGGIMSPDFIALTENATAKEAIASLQRENIEMAFYLYVVDDDMHLVGVISLRQLVLVPPETKLKEIMSTDIVSVQTSMDQEDVAKIVARYNLLAVPVVDENNKLVGIVTVDDVIDIIREEATEDILKMAGAGEEFVAGPYSVLKSIRKRIPWLFASWIGGIIASYVIKHFQHDLNKLVYLAAFMPIIMGMGGNVGNQSSTIVVRGLATGRLNVKQFWQIISTELSTGFVLGFIYGTLLGMFANFQYEIWALGLVVGLGMVCSMTLAAAVGSFLPLIFMRFHVDPAVATGPFVSTATDVLSMVLYFNIAKMLIF
nr:magnesium transporter [Desulfobacterales bacterium]